MKSAILLLFTLSLASCNFLGETSQDDNFIGSIPDQDLLLWLDASQEGTLHDDGGGMNILSWDDLSENHHILNPAGVQAQSYIAELNGLNVLTFTASTNAYSLSAISTATTSNYSLIAMIEPDPGFNGAIFSSGGSAKDFSLNESLQQLSFIDSAGTQTSTTGISSIDSKPMIISFIFETPTAEVFINGSSVYSTTYSPYAITTDITLWDAMSPGALGEILFYNRALSTSEREFLENYLMQKWGI